MCLSAFWYSTMPSLSSGSDTYSKSVKAFPMCNQNLKPNRRNKHFFLGVSVFPLAVLIVFALILFILLFFLFQLPPCRLVVVRAVGRFGRCGGGREGER